MLRKCCDQSSAAPCSKAGSVLQDLGLAVVLEDGSRFAAGTLFSSGALCIGGSFKDAAQPRLGDYPFAADLLRSGELTGFEHVKCLALRLPDLPRNILRAPDRMDRWFGRVRIRTASGLAD